MPSKPLNQMNASEFCQWFDALLYRGLWIVGIGVVVCGVAVLSSCAGRIVAQ